MTILLVILGIIGLAIESQFTGQDTISWALIIIGALGVIFQVAWTVFVASKVNKSFKEFDRSFFR